MKKIVMKYGYLLEKEFQKICDLAIDNELIVYAYCDKYTEQLKKKNIDVVEIFTIKPIETEKRMLADKITILETKNPFRKICLKAYYKILKLDLGFLTVAEMLKGEMRVVIMHLKKRLDDKEVDGFICLDLFAVTTVVRFKRLFVKQEIKVLLDFQNEDVNDLGEWYPYISRVTYGKVASIMFGIVNNSEITRKIDEIYFVKQYGSKLVNKSNNYKDYFE